MFTTSKHAGDISVAHFFLRVTLKPSAHCVIRSRHRRDSAATSPLKLLLCINIF